MELFIKRWFFFYTTLVFNVRQFSSVSEEHLSQLKQENIHQNCSTLCFEHVFEQTQMWLHLSLEVTALYLFHAIQTWSQSFGSDANKQANKQTNASTGVKKTCGVTFSYSQGAAGQPGPAGPKGKPGPPVCFGLIVFHKYFWIHSTAINSGQYLCLTGNRGQSFLQRFDIENQTEIKYRNHIFWKTRCSFPPKIYGVNEEKIKWSHN